MKIKRFDDEKVENKLEMIMLMADEIYREGLKHTEDSVRSDDIKNALLIKSYCRSIGRELEL